MNHRELRIHPKSFAAVLSRPLREDPDLILMGKMRDLEIIAILLNPQQPDTWFLEPCYAQGR